MIDENRLNHMLGVARNCYKLALADGKNEEVARTYWVMGLLHDIGYEFSENGEDHAEIGYEILRNLGTKNAGIFRWNLIQKAIREHGNPDARLFNTDNDKIRILNEADMTTNYDGTNVTLGQRLSDIEKRYGKKSNEYKKSEKICKKIINKRKTKD